MVSYRYLVFTRPVAGQEEEYNRWYDTQHLQDLLEIPGVTSAQRFSAEIDGQTQYLAIYNLETDDPKACLAEMEARSGTERMPMTPALDFSSINHVVYTPRGPALRKGSR